VLQMLLPEVWKVPSTGNLSMLLALFSLISFLVPSADADRFHMAQYQAAPLLEPTVFIATIKGDSTWGLHGCGVLLDLGYNEKRLQFLVTNRHLVDGQDSIKLFGAAFSQEGDTRLHERFEITLDLHHSIMFVPSSPDSDFALIAIPPIKGEVAVPSVKIQDVCSLANLQLGEPVRFVGAPRFDEYGLYGTKQKFPLVRSGAVAYISTEDVFFRGSQKYLLPGMLLIDGVSMGGNSGGPVFTYRNVVVRNDSTGTMELGLQCQLIGIVKGHLPAKKTMTLKLSNVPVVSDLIDSLLNTADSVVVGRIPSDVKVNYEENSNLAVVISMDTIISYLVHSLETRVHGG